MMLYKAITDGWLPSNLKPVEAYHADKNVNWHICLCINSIVTTQSLILVYVENWGNHLHQDFSFSVVAQPSNYGLT